MYLNNRKKRRVIKLEKCYNEFDLENYILHTLLLGYVAPRIKKTCISTTKKTTEILMLFHLQDFLGYFFCKNNIFFL